MLAARVRKLITARARKNKLTARMLTNARKDYSIPLLFTHAKQKASKAGAKHAGLGVEACERSEQEAPTQSSLPFSVGVQFSSDSIRAFNDRINMRENRRR